MDLLAKHYVPRTWEHFTIDPFDEEAMADQPKTQTTHVRCFSSESDLALSTEYSLEKKAESERTASLDGIVVWDYELINAGFPELHNAGGSLEELSEDWHGHPAGALVMTAFRSVPREGKIAKVVFETFIAR